MRAIVTFLLALLLPAVASCGGELSDDSGSRGVPQSAIRTTSLDATWSLSLRGITAQDPFVTTAARAFVADGIVEFAAEDGSVAVLFSVENLDPRATACHPSGIFLDDVCLDRAAFPYVVFASSPVSEVYLGGRFCTAPRDGSALEMTADTDHGLYRLRAVAPVVCPTGETETFEVRVERVDAETTWGAQGPTLGGTPALVE